MVGITSYGAYIPLLRISRKTISAATGWLGTAPGLPGEKAVANYDEDSLTMAVAAAVDCLGDIDRDKVDDLYFATTTSPYRERQGAVIVATALDLRPDIRTADFSNSIKAGTTALLSAIDTVKAGSAKNVIVCASDSRQGKAGSSQEQSCGDGAASLLIGDGDAIATLEGSHSLSYDFVDYWRTDTDRYDRLWEDRWIRDIGYSKFIPAAITGLLQKYGLSIQDFAKVAYPSLYPREHAAIGKKLGAEPEQIQDQIFTSVGDTGTAYPLMMLVAALEEAKPGDKIMVLSYGNGCDVLFFQVTAEIEKIKDRKGIKGYLASRKDLDNYEKYATFRDLLAVDTGRRGEDVGATQMSTLWRERRMVLGLCGSICRRCGTPQFPRQVVCANPDCGAVNEMDTYRFSDKSGHMFTYTGDSLAPSPNPPAIYGVVAFDGGGRYTFDLTDCDLNALEVGMPVEMSFRRKYRDTLRGVHGYFWKATPPRV
ncbi:MAG: hydroxymethylglutaryl-CoA synthase family protein [Dehalococcoidia bacterium]|nr:MAG: hydroxymethylglutaryl-CoA synthase family protein [Dehalococcoidia bacterium]